MSQTSESPQPRQRAEYDSFRPVLRLAIALSVVGMVVVTNYNGDELITELRCTGGFWDGLKVFGAFLLSIALIEAINWAVWTSSPNEILSSPQLGNTESADGTTPTPLYALGGQFLLAPKGAALGLLFAVGIAAVTVLVIGFPDPCGGPRFTVVSWTRYLVSAYALLALISFGENRLSEASEKAKAQ